jgi:AcrR family transcriptional regulator
LTQKAIWSNYKLIILEIMVLNIYKGDKTEKANQIIDAAQKRFALHGFEKTTMKEIAGDLNMSKGSLYYYFPDKEHLYKAIVCKEHDLFILTLREEIHKLADPSLMLRKYVEIRLDLFRMLINLSRSRLNTLPGINSFLQEIIANLWLQEKETVKEILETGNALGKFEIENTDETSELLLHLLKGLRLIFLKEMTVCYPDRTEYELLVKKTTLFVILFIKGIKK